MAYFTEDDAYKLWQMTNKSWEALYNLLYRDYYEGHKIGLERRLVYQVMQVAGGLQDSDTPFPETWEEFHAFINQQLGNYLVPLI